MTNFVSELNFSTVQKRSRLMTSIKTLNSNCQNLPPELIIGLFGSWMKKTGCFQPPHIEKRVASNHTTQEKPGCFQHHTQEKNGLLQPHIGKNQVPTCFQPPHIGKNRFQPPHIGKKRFPSPRKKQLPTTTHRKKRVASLLPTTTHREKTGCSTTTHRKNCVVVGSNSVFSYVLQQKFCRVSSNHHHIQQNFCQLVPTTPTYSKHFVRLQ